MPVFARTDAHSSPAVDFGWSFRRMRTYLPPLPLFCCLYACARWFFFFLRRRMRTPFFCLGLERVASLSHPRACAYCSGRQTYRRMRTSPGFLLMAAIGKNGLNIASSSSDEDEAEVLQRVREAAWDPPRGGLEASAAEKLLLSDKPSLRTKAGHNEEDANELQTTAGFKAHVAKKLGAILDSSVMIWNHPSGTIQEKKEEEVADPPDDGFRLFSSSLPENSEKPESLPSIRRKKRRYSSSSSSSEEWRRCQEAAMTAADILKGSGAQKGGEVEASAVTDRGPANILRKKKKKKRKQDGDQHNV
ncbi:protein CUSTOS [Anolis sagrei]|uniref:protein CUSTOS n=1 Tax=Anolis sagrei TaxID=38937 RepID=UPI0035205F44